MKNNDLRNQRRGGFYWKDNKPYATVTTILNIVDKPALRYWYGREVYRAMVKDPTLSEKEAMASPYKKTKKAQVRGTTVHSIVEVFKHKPTTEEYKKWLDNIHEDYRGYANALYKWVTELDVNFIEREKTVFSEKYQYAGTLDLLAQINGNRALTVVDVKTGKDIYMGAYIQGSAYAHALEETGMKIKEIAVLLLRPNGTYKYDVASNMFDSFLAAKKLWQTYNTELCTKMGYLPLDK